MSAGKVVVPQGEFTVSGRRGKIQDGDCKVLEGLIDLRGIELNVED